MLLKDFLKNENGTITVMFAGSMLAILGLSGVSVDYARLLNAKQQAQNVLDASLLAAATEYQKSGSKQKAKSVGIEHMTSSLPDIVVKNLDVNVENNYLVGSYNGEIDNVFMSLLANPTSHWVIDAKINLPGKIKTDFALAVDVSSTMINFNLFDGLKSSLNDFSQQVFDNTKTEEVTVSVAPFSNAVAFEAKYTKWLDPKKGYSQAKTFNGCFEYKKLGGKHALDKSNYSNRIAAFGRSIKPKKTVIPFCAKTGSEAAFYLDNQNDLNSKIASLSTAQGTNTAEGLTWAWRMLSPSWQSTFGESNTHPLPDSPSNKKVLILLTDGKPYNIPTVKVKGEDKNQARKDALKEFEKVCSQIVAAGNIDLYTIVYGNVMSEVQRKAIRKCIAGNGQSFWGGNSTQLSSILSHIVNRNKELALSR